MTKLYSICIVLAVLSLIAFMFILPDVPDSKSLGLRMDTQNTSLYSNNQYGFQLEYPVDWKENKIKSRYLLGTEDIVEFTFPANGSHSNTMASVTVGVKDNYYGLEYDIKKMYEVSDLIDIDTVQPVNISDSPAIKIHYRISPQNNDNLHYRISPQNNDNLTDITKIYVPKSHKAFIINILLNPNVVDHDLYENISRDINIMLNSFRFSFMSLPQPVIDGSKNETFWQQVKPFEKSIEVFDPKTISMTKFDVKIYGIADNHFMYMFLDISGPNSINNISQIYFELETSESKNNLEYGSNLNLGSPKHLDPLTISDKFNNTSLPNNRLVSAYSVSNTSHLFHKSWEISYALCPTQNSTQYCISSPISINDDILLSLKIKFYDGTMIDIPNLIYFHYLGGLIDQLSFGPQPLSFSFGEPFLFIRDVFDRISLDERTNYLSGLTQDEIQDLIVSPDLLKTVNLFKTLAKQKLFQFLSLFHEDELCTLSQNLNNDVRSDLESRLQQYANTTIVTKISSKCY